MTRGALVAVVALILAAVAGFVLLENRIADTSAQSNANAAALREVCGQTQKLKRVARAGAGLAQALIASASSSVQLRRAAASALAAFNSYKTAAAQHRACSAVTPSDTN